MQDQLQKAINLAKKTGDRLIVFDSAKPDNVFVVMSLKDYENMVLGKSGVRGLTEDELLDKINRDIAVWKSDQNSQENLDYFESLTSNSSESKNPESFEKIIKKSKRGWPIPGKVRSNAEEVIEEDRQYLEELNF